ncbi:MAG: HAD family hydrolase [Desulfuromonadaceae bacterium]
MITIDIPGFRTLELAHVACDYNGTLAEDGRLIPGVAELFTTLAASVSIHVITADTFGIAQSELAGLPVELHIIGSASQDQAKLDFVNGLGAEQVVAIGNGRNDRLMLKGAALGIALIQREGASAGTVASADIISAGITDALELLLNPKRLIATLRS